MQFIYNIKFTLIGLCLLGFNCWLPSCIKNFWMNFLEFFFSPSCALCSKYINISYIFCLICILTICEQILLITLYLYQAPCSLIEHSIPKSWFQSGFFSQTFYYLYRCMILTLSFILLQLFSVSAFYGFFQPVARSRILLIIQYFHNPFF